MIKEKLLIKTHHKKEKENNQVTPKKAKTRAETKK